MKHYIQPLIVSIFLLSTFSNVHCQTLKSDKKTGTIQLDKVRKDVSIISINKEDTKEDDEFRTSCEKWTLDKAAIMKIVALSKPISSHDFMYLYYVLPCEIKGKLVVDNTTYDYIINAGSFMKLSYGDTTYYYDCSDKEIEKYFLSKGGNPKRDLGE